MIRFGFVGKPNLLYDPTHLGAEPPLTGTWKNWGGDKVWPAPQDMWGWPPEPEYDGDAWDAVAVPGGVRMASRVKSSKFGLRFTRTISLSKNKARATIENTLINDSGKPVKFAVWEVCQVDDPESCYLPIWKSTEHPKGWRVYGDDNVDGLVREKGRELEVHRDTTRGIKYGSGSPDSHGSALVHGYTITIRAPYKPGALYPDQGDAQEIWTSADPTKYCELEITGPVEQIQPGQSISLKVELDLKAK